VEDLQKPKTDQQRKKLIARLKRIEGQVRGVQRMIQEEADCSEILNQIAAIKAAIHHAGIIVFENHAQECIARSLDQEDSVQNLDEIVKVMGRLIK
jgi:DNA-binding FrmR family transcriptional regulator